MDEYNNANANNGNDAGEGNNSNANQNQGTQEGKNDSNNNSSANNANDNANNNANEGNGEGGGEDYKKKFGESTTENQRITDILKTNGIDPKTGKKTEVNNNQNNDNQRANNDDNNSNNSTDNFTDAELEKAVPGFAYLSSDEKDTIRNAKNMAKDVTSLKRTVAEIHDERVFGKELREAVKQEGMELIKAHEEEFKAFAYEEDNLKVPFKHVANSFILKKTRELGTGNNANGNEGEENKVEGMESGTGGGKELGKSVGDTLEVTGAEAKRLRKEDPRRYNELARKGKLKIVD